MILSEAQASRKRFIVNELLSPRHSNLTFLFMALQVRHDNKDQLEKLKDMVVLIEQKLSPAITVETHSSRLASMKSGKFSSCTRGPGTCCPVYIMPVADDK